ncbi:MAG: phage antirepressor KilAC domain-containing protein [Oscillospiraceae bacterium]|jgi:prophage antirepressor-like protein|nr:phage antirepressor KilAC domain-containing protein [Oscillospiraceae bacterium]
MTNTTHTPLHSFSSAEFGELAILVQSGKPYFPATECARILGYKNPQKAVRDHCKGVNESFTPSSGGVQQTKFIPEGDLYRLIIRSKLPAAERFERWVFDEVLPGIRKHGAYIMPNTLDEMLSSPKLAEALIRRLDKERNRSALLETRNAELLPKAQYCDLVLLSENTIPVSLIAKDYGLTAVRFNKMLHDFGIQYRIADTWLLYKKYASHDYTQTRTYYGCDGRTMMHTCWTQKGRLFLYEFLKEFGIFPLAEFGSARELSA